MVSYYVSTQPQSNGEHPVHRSGCEQLPDEPHRVFLGSFADCHEAVKSAKRHFPYANGCAFCLQDCHTG